MTETKAQPTDRTVEDFLAAVEHPVRREDGFELLDLRREITGQVPVSPRKANLALYGLTYGPDIVYLLPRLGKHKTGVACLCINKLDDVDREVLAEMVRTGYGHVMAELHRP